MIYFNMSWGKSERNSCKSNKKLSTNYAAKTFSREKKIMKNS